jgi:hypothetical protein
MEMEGESPLNNPYVAPQHTAPAAGTGETGAFTRPALWRVTLTWLGLCAIGGAPSFVLAMSVVSHPLRVPTMLLGVLLFALICVIVHLYIAAPRLRRMPRLRAAVRTAYSLRVVATMLMPFGWFFDMSCGAASVQLANSLFGSVDRHPGTILFTVLLQGVLLNAVLLALIPPLYAVILICRFSSTVPEAPEAHSASAS